jgi:thiol-disulfide isomerase/thioredoxin
LQTRKVGWIITTALLVVGLTGCRNLPRGGLGRGPDVRTIAGIGLGPERLAIRDGAPSTISSRVDPPSTAEGPSEVVGQVVDDRGVPVANARVRLAVDGTPGGREVVGTTNRSGQFLLKGLRPGEEYTLIAEWDDGREFLLGRSMISSPAEKIRIEVAAVGGSDGSSIASNAGLESSRAASFNREDRAPERISLLSDRPDESTSAPRRGDRASGRDRAGWIPFDSVNRTALEPSGPGEDQQEEPPFTESDRGIERPATPGVAKSDPDLRPSRAEPDRLQERLEAIRDSPDLDPNDFPLPMAAASEPSTVEPSAPEVRSPAARPNPMPEPRPMTAGSPRTTTETVPLVRRFEPARDRDRGPPDPPLLMTDTPPETEDLDGETAADARSASSAGQEPGSMRLPDPPASRPTAPAEATAAPTLAPEIVARPDAASAGLPGEAEDEMGTAEDEGFDFPEPLEPAELPPVGDSTVEDRDEVTTVAPDPAAPARLVDADRGEGLPSIGPEAEPVPGGSEAMAAENARTFRWSDLPPPGPLITEGAAEDEEEGAAPEANGPGRWSRGLLKWVSREQSTPDQVASIEPLVRFDAERDRLEDFILPDLNGERFRLKETESDYVLLCFWGTWCDPCVAAMPHLADLQRQFGPRRLRVVSIASQRNGEGGPRTLSRMSRRLGLNYPILLAPTDQPCPVAGAMGVQYYPTLILLDREGNVVHRETGATGDKLMRLDRAIAAAMDESVMTVTKR